MDRPSTWYFRFSTKSASHGRVVLKTWHYETDRTPIEGLPENHCVELGSEFAMRRFENQFLESRFQEEGWKSEEAAIQYFVRAARFACGDTRGGI